MIIINKNNNNDSCLLEINYQFWAPRIGTTGSQVAQTELRLYIMFKMINFSSFHVSLSTLWRNEFVL